MWEWTWLIPWDLLLLTLLLQSPAPEENHCDWKYFLVVFKYFFFFDVDHLKNLHWICYRIVSVLCFVFLGYVLSGILAPLPGIEPTPPWSGSQSLNHQTTREAPGNILRAEHLRFFCFAFNLIYWSIVDLQCCVSFWCNRNYFCV